MMIKHYSMIILLSLLGFVQAKGQDCDELLRKHAILKERNKRTEAEKIKKQIQSKDCNTKKVNEYLYHDRSAQKRPAKTSEFKLSEDTVFIGYQGSEHVVTVQGGNSWKAEVDSGWCKIKKESSRIIIRCQENPSMKKRMAKIIVTSGTKSRNIVVTNEGAPEMLRSAFESLSFPSEGDKNEVEITSNTDWYIDSKPNWVTIESDNMRMVVSAEPNKQNVERAGDVVICTPTSSTVVIKVYQGAVDEHLTFSKNNIVFGPDGGDEYIKVYTNVESWVFNDLPWCQVQRVDNDMIKIHCDPNKPIDEERRCVVNVNGVQNSDIVITQKAKPIQYMVPSMGIGGRALSFGINAGMVVPMISASADGFTGSVVNYALGNNSETASYKSGVGFSLGVFADIRLYPYIYLIAGVNYLQYSYKNEFNADVYRRIYQTERYYQAGNTQNRYEEEYKMTQIEVPILASYRLPVTKKSHIQVNLGPVFNYGLSAKMKVKGYTSSESTYYYAIENGQMTDKLYDKRVQSIQDKGNGEFDLYEKDVTYTKVNKDGQAFDKSNSVEDSPFKKLNVGVRLGVAYEYHGASLALEYTYMFSNMANDKYWNGNRWRIFDQSALDFMSGYKQRNHYMGIKFGYTFRY